MQRNATYDNKSTNKTKIVKKQVCIDGIFVEIEEETEENNEVEKIEQELSSFYLVPNTTSNLVSPSPQSETGEDPRLRKELVSSCSNELTMTTEEEERFQTEYGDELSFLMQSKMKVDDQVDPMFLSYIS